MRQIMELLNLPPRYVELTRSSDGFFLGRESGDIGFNAFLGCPSFHDGPGRDQMLSTWGGWGFGDRRRAVHGARHFRLSVREMLVGA